MSVRAVAAIAAASLALGIAGADADDGDPAALFAAGTRAYEAGDYGTAIVAYEEVYRRTPLPGAAFSLAQAHRNRYFVDGDVLHLHRALALYRSYLTEAQRGAHRQHAVMHIETIEILLAHVAPPATVSTVPAAPPPAPPSTQFLVSSEAAGATARVDGGPAARTPRLFDVSPGPHRIRVEAPGHAAVERSWPAIEGQLVVVPMEPAPRPARLHVAAPAGARLLLDGVPLETRSAPIEVPAGEHEVVVLQRGHHAVSQRVALGFGEERSFELAPRPTRQRRVARILAIAGGGLLVASGGAALIALDAQQDAEALPPPPRDAGDIGAYEDARNRRDAWRTTAVSLGVSAAVVGVTSALLWRFDDPSVPRRDDSGVRAPAIEPLLGADRVGVSVRMALE